MSSDLRHCPLSSGACCPPPGVLCPLRTPAPSQAVSRVAAAPRGFLPLGVLVFVSCLPRFENYGRLYVMQLFFRGVCVFDSYCPASARSGNPSAPVDSTARPLFLKDTCLHATSSQRIPSRGTRASAASPCPSSAPAMSLPPSRVFGGLPSSLLPPRTLRFVRFRLPLPFLLIPQGYESLS